MFIHSPPSVMGNAWPTSLVPQIPETNILLFRSKNINNKEITDLLTRGNTEAEELLGHFLPTTIGT